MFKRKALACLILSSSAVSLNSYAADGIINFTGNITATACTVNKDSNNQTVTLGTVNQSALAAEGVTAAAKLFTIDLEDCPAGLTGHIRFDGNVNEADPRILAVNPGQTATNVGVAIFDRDNLTLVPIGEASKDYVISDAAATTNTEYTFTYYAKYMAVGGAAGPGSANATATFTVVYN